MKYLKKNGEKLINLEHAREIEKGDKYLEITFEYGNTIIKLTDEEKDMPVEKIIANRKIIVRQ